MIPRTFPTNPTTGYWRVFDITPSGTQVAWVDYIPVEDIGGIEPVDSRYDDLTGYEAEVLGSVAGLVAWVDYTPVDIRTGTNWTSNDAGVIPIYTP